jgi:outer membrane protein TolC
MTLRPLIAASLLGAALLQGQVGRESNRGSPAWTVSGDGGLTSAYRTPDVPPVYFDNSSRLDQLLRGGKLYLSLRDAISLGLENNLDLELERYSPRIADTDLLRARAGEFLRGIPLSVREGPAGLGSPVIGPNGTLGGGDIPALNSLVGPGVQTDLSILGSLPLSTGPAVPKLDPSIVGTLNWSHQADPQNSVFLTNLQSLNSNTGVANIGIQQGFLTGGTVGLSWNNTRQNINNPLYRYNPATNSSLALTFVQPLLRGFGWSANNRYIRIAKNNRQVSDLVFKQQVITTVSAIARLYWDLATLVEDVRVRQEAVASAEQLLADTKNQMEAGTAAPIDLTRAEAELTRRQRDLSVARTLVRRQDVVLKDYLTRKMLDQSLAAAEVVLTDRIQIPEREPVQPVQDLTQKAFESRPDLAQARLQLENSQISLRGSKSALRPALDLVASAQNNALAGEPNAFATTIRTNGASGLIGNPLGPAGDPSFLTGYGGALSQIFRRSFPDYSIGVQLELPLKNRAARADVIRDQLSVRQQQIRLQQLEKQVALEITNALIAVEEARASYEASVKDRLLQQQTLDAEREKVDVGASTAFYVIQFQRDLAAARSAEVSAESSYLKAKIALQRAVGSILDDYGVVMAEAATGSVSRPSDLVPPVGK